MNYRHTKEMGEISGMGGGYEEVCQLMLESGCEWLESNPKADPRFKGNKNIFGIVFEDNDDAKALTEAIVSGAPDRDCTGAMHHAVTLRCLKIKRDGWNQYVKEVLENNEEEESMN